MSAGKTGATTKLKEAAEKLHNLDMALNEILTSCPVVERTEWGVSVCGLNNRINQVLNDALFEVLQRDGSLYQDVKDAVSVARESALKDVKRLAKKAKR